ncbi:MAG: DUF2459 domain-containing protein [Sphingomonadaceae bacterium]
MWRGAAWLVALAAAVLLLGALLPRGGGALARAGEAGAVTIGVEATLAHTEIIVPVTAAGHDWRVRLPPGSVPDGVTHLSFSWGDRDFFLATPTWADVDVRLALRALFASRSSLVHVYRLGGFDGRPVTIDARGYRRLVAFLEGEIAAGDPIAGYGADDFFLPGTGRYGWWRTCNQWAGDALAAAGVRVGLWTPFAQGLIWRFDRVETSA